MVVRRRGKAVQLFHVSHKQVIAVVVAGDENAIPSPINRYFTMLMLKLVKLLHALSVGIISKDRRESIVILLKNRTLQSPYSQMPLQLECSPLPC